jgi:hypothetical protein
VITNQIFGVILKLVGSVRRRRDSSEGPHTSEKLLLRKMLRGLASERTDGDDNVSMSTIIMMIIIIFNSHTIVTAQEKNSKIISKIKF